MVPTAAGAGDLVRVTVASGTRRVDLALPGAVPVAELVPELARSVGLLDAGSAHGGYRLVTAHGRELADGTGLVGQGVTDGGLLVVTARVHDEPLEVHDDAAEAMAGLVERELVPWRPGHGRRTALGAGCLLCALGAVTLASQRESSLAGPAAAAVAAALVSAAIAWSRRRREPVGAVAIAWIGTLYAAVAGLMLPTGYSPLGPASLAAASAAAAGMVCLVGLGAGRTLALPAVVVGTVFLADGVLREVGGVPPAVVPTGALVLVLVVGGVFPRLALGATRSARGQRDARRRVDLDRLGTDARTAHEILVGVSASVGLLLVASAPLAVTRGPGGAALAVAACAVVMLRARHHRAAGLVLVGAVSGILGLTSTAAAALWLEPTWRPMVALGLVTAGTAALAWVASPPGPSTRLSRLGDLAEGAAVLALPPLLLVASGLLAGIRR